MSRFTTSVAPILVGLYLLSALLYSGFSLSNLLNLLRVAIGLILVGYGIHAWFRAAERSENPLPTDVSPATRSNESSGFKKYYILYLKYLVAAPLAVALILWLLAIKIAGCKMSGATMQVVGCGTFGTLVTYVQLYVMLFAAAMCTVLIPLTIVYLLQAVSRKSF